MTATDPTTPFDTDPEAALAAITAHPGPIIVDLDETLYLRNSTSDFIDSARPSLLAYLLIKAVDVIKPWRVSGGDEGRDLWRVRILLLLMPWTLPRWRARASATAQDGVNRRLAETLQATEAEVVVSTLGFAPIVRPLIANFAIGETGIMAMSPWRGSDRKRGKLALTTEAMGREAVAASVVITDSAEDEDLLRAGGSPLRVVWPEANPTPLFERLYLPGRYLAVVKRPGSQYIRSKIVKEDIALWILSTVWLAANPFGHVAGLLLLAISFWAVYEIGYVDNDRMAAAHEGDPKLSDAFHDLDHPFQYRTAVMWAIVAGALGVVAVRWSDAPSIVDGLRWAGLLVVVFAVFRIYNRLDKTTRIALFPILQLLRSAAFAVLVPLPPVAAVAVTIHVLISSLKYYVYRSGGGTWVPSDLSVIRLVVFVSGAVLVGRQGEWSELFSATAISLLAWHLLLARRELPDALAAAHRIDRG